MQLVEGDYCTAVEHTCVAPFKDHSWRCQRYATSSHCYPPVIKKRFCMDRYEYPNRAGAKPVVMVNYGEAKAACEQAGKRLCTAREWTLACEGPALLPYPYGYVRDPQICNIDQAHRFPSAEALVNLATREEELARLDQRAPSGSFPNCVSAYGVYDLTGNVDEWVTPDGPEEPAGLNAEVALKGGYFGPVRTRCRPSTTAHGPTFKFYQVGFRCCADVPSSAVRN
jgi:formylglycine-generating enzyme required for sulfatase activity